MGFNKLIIVTKTLSSENINQTGLPADHDACDSPCWIDWR